jgi:hypothetical protein
MVHGSVYMLLCWVTVMPVLISCSRVADVSMKASAKPLPQHLQAPIVAACVGLGESQEHLMGPCLITCVANISVPNASLRPLALHVVTASHLGTWRKRQQHIILFDTKVINSTKNCCCCCCSSRAIWRPPLYHAGIAPFVRVVHLGDFAADLAATEGGRHNGASHHE